MPTLKTLTCPQCGKTFERELKCVNKSSKQGKLMFCSQSCSSTVMWENVWAGKKLSDKERKRKKAAYHKIYMRKWYAKPENKKKQIERAAKNYKKYRKEYVKFVNTYKAEHGCKHCGLKDSRCLVFHHRNPDEKEFNIAEGTRRLINKEKLFKEIKKCDVLCANCHRILHRKLKN